MGHKCRFVYFGARALCHFQYKGLLDSLNAIRSIAMEYSMPICMMVGLLGKEDNVVPSDSNKYRSRIVEPILGAMAISHYLPETNSDFSCVTPAINEACKLTKPVVFLVGRPSH